jgi:hypothetical protein
MRPAFTRVEDRDVERRASQRRRTLLAAKLVFDEPGVIVNCGVRNLSPLGALIELESAILLRPPYRLLTIRDGVIYEAELVWSWGRRVGLNFTAEHPVQAPASETTQLLRTIWSAVRP